MRFGDILTPDEITARKTHKGKDDLAFTEARAGRRKKAETPPAPEGGCCATCPHWRKPLGTGVYGSCRIAFVTKREGIVSADEARELGVFGGDELRTAAGFTCSQWGKALQAERPAAMGSLRALVRREAS